MIERFGRVPVAVYEDFNPNLLRPAAARAVLGAKDRKVFEKLYPALPKLKILTGKIEDGEGDGQIMSRYPADYVAAAAEVYNRAPHRQKRAQLSGFSIGDIGRSLVSAAIEDLDARLYIAGTIDPDTKKAVIPGRDVAYCLNVGIATVTDWCRPDSGFIQLNRSTSRILIPEETLRNMLVWETPSGNMTSRAQPID